MNRHQVLTGAANFGDHCFSSGSVEGVHFTAYATGCDIVILASDFQRVQIIPGAIHGKIQVACVNCSADSGKIAASYGEKVCVFEPTPLLNPQSTHKLDYQWYHTGTITAECQVKAVSWNQDGSRLLTGGDIVQMWQCPDLPPQDQSGSGEDGVSFFIDDSGHEEKLEWRCMWQCRPATPVHKLMFSPDGLLFASVGKDDRLAKIWYENKKVQFKLMRSDSVSPKKEEINFAFVYIAHPKAVTGFSWRKTSKYMPRGSVANMLITSCRDNICRIWVETILPEDGLIDMQQLEPQAVNPMFHTHRHKNRFMQRLHHMRHVANRRRRNIPGNHPQGVTPLPSAQSEHDFHKFGVHPNSVAPGFHFHLAASINPETDIPLLPVVNSQHPERDSGFVVHWLNNKELHFTVEAEKIMMDMSKDTTTAREEDADQGSDEVDAESTSDDVKPAETTETAPVTVAPAPARGRNKFLHRSRNHMSTESDVSMGSMASMHSAMSQATHTSGQTEGSKISLEIEEDKKSESLAVDRKYKKKKRDKKKRKFGECPSSPRELVKALRFCMSAPNLRKVDGEEDVDLDVEVVDDDDDLFSTNNNDPTYASLNFLDIRHSASSYFSVGGPDRTSRLSQSSFGQSVGNISKYLSFADLASAFPRVCSYATLCKIQDGHLDALDYRIEALLRDWHQSVDMLFGVHPVDGSFLVWLIDWLDEYTPGSFRQAQVSFSSRIPHALPVCDAMTMSTNLLLYCNHSKLDIKATLKESASKVTDMEKPLPRSYQSFATGRNSPGQSDNTMTPNVLMLSKHSNGTLNLWQITFAENSRFSTILSVAHASRASGHRFHANSAACHPVLPLLVTTSHHNSPIEDSNITHEQKSETGEEEGFCSELILWRVDSVGPLSQSGGITELARINSPEVSAFSNVAWLPTLLPSSTLGPVSNSPSALFVASDGGTLQIYMAVIDARTLLTELRAKPKSEVLDMSRSNSSTSSGYVMNSPGQDTLMKEVYNVVSLQSTARPGCIIELQTINDAKQDWKHVQLMHVFQEQLVTGKKTGQYDKQGHAHLEAIVDLQNITVFEEHFYLVVVDRMPSGVSVLHMWRIVIASMEESQAAGDHNQEYSPDTRFFQDSDEQDRAGHGAAHNAGENVHMASPRISITTNKVCTQVLELPDGIKVTHATMSAGHLSSSTIYPACFAPYLLSAACTDGQVRFWKCQSSSEEEENGVLPKFEWVEWEMMIPSDDSSAIKVAGKPLSVSCSYSGRVAVAYRMGHVRTQNDNPDSKFVNLYVSIYECESTGGSEWTLEDTIQLKNISIPEVKCNIDLSVIYNNDHNSDDEGDGYVLISPTMATPAIVKNVPIPSSATIQSVKKTLNTRVDHSNVLKQKHLVLLDWVSTEDGSHILTVGVGPKVLLFAPVSSEVALASQKEKDTKKMPLRRQLQKTKSMTVMSFVEEIRWMKIRSIDLSTSDGLPPLPMHISWVRDGILVVGMDNEMHVYSQWRGPGEGMDSLGGSVGTTGTVADNRTLTEQSLRSVASTASLGVPKAFKNSYSSTSITALASSVSSASLDKRGTPNREKEIKKSDSVSSLQLIQDCGLFEAARLANPVLPQYHPKQLIELLNFGKIRRVKAILAHLVRCIAGNEYGLSPGMAADDVSARHRLFSSPRPLSVTTAATTTDGKLLTDDSSDSLEIASIPPLPLYALLAADSEKTTYNLDASGATPVGGGGSQSKDNDYSTLFNPDVDEDLEDPFDDNEIFAASPSGRDRRRSSVAQGPQNPNYFGPPQSRLLARHLTRTQLPGLASLDQMYLLALADTVANTRVEFGEKETPDVAVSKVVARESGQPEISTEGLDDCGLRYMLAARHHVYLMNTLPMMQRVKFQKTGLHPQILVWAFHSEAEEELLNVIPSVQKGEPLWNELRVFGVGWWVRNITTLRKIIEKVAKAAFQVKKDPMDAALFYIAMKKKTLVWGLFRSVSDQKMADFFKNDFTQDRWRRAALKNAFALMARQRFHHAAAFFLLAGAVQDAVEVCLNKLSDLQLAMVITRLYESEYDEAMPSGLKRLLYDICLGGEGDDVDVTTMHPDPFIRSMTYWMLKDYSAALGTLLETQAGSNYMDKEKDDADDDSYNSSPNVFNFYNYLRTHPLLVRQQLAMTAADKNQTVLLSGFSRGNKAGDTGDKNVTYIDRITPVERRLYFTTAHMHFKSGCPMLALEVLSTLPDIIDMDSDITKSRSADSMTKQASITTGTLPDTSKSSDFDWSQPVSSKIETADAFDWSTPVKADTSQNVDSFDWSTPVNKFEDEGLDLSLDKEGDQDDGDTKSDSEIEVKDKLNLGSSAEAALKDMAISHNKGDIMTHQLKFIACLKIMMEELSTLATGFEVDGGQLRYQLYIWLEKQVDCLKQQCGYGSDIDDLHPVTIKEATEGKETAETLTLSGATKEGKATLHEIILAEKLDFEAKQVRMARRKQWLKANQQLLRTLLSYSVLHGSCGGGLASVRMELILLLQELQQEKTKQQLLSPLPFPTSLPLLSASVASAKTVIADPIRHLQSMTQDILHSLVEFTVPPALNHQLNKVFLLRNLSAALAACVYQCLCDSDSFVVALCDNIDVGMEGFANTSVVYKDSYLMAGAQHRGRSSTGGEPDAPNSQPSKWPGVSQLRALLAREKDEDLPKLNILLCEVLVAVYMSLLVHALAMFDANILYRLVAHPYNEKMWPALFGGGIRKLIEVTTSSVAQQRHVKPQDELSKQRMKLHMKVMGATSQQSSQHLKEDKPTYKEKFIPPEVSMISYFMTKPYQNPNDEAVDYDSAESAPSSDEEDDEFDFKPMQRRDAAMNEHLDPNSYSWCLLRYVIVKYIRQSLLSFLPKIGIDIPELPVCSPLMQSVCKTMEKWEEILQVQLELFNGPPEDYIPGCFVDTSQTGPPIHKYKTMTEPTNTPFLSSHFSALPAKRLWHYLIKQEPLQDTFIRYIFRSRRHPEDFEDSMKDQSDSSGVIHTQPMKIIHKEQEVITSFCLNQANLNCMAVATQKEVVEMDVSGILSPPVWLEDETEYDIEAIKNPSPSKVEAEEFLLIQAPQDKPGMIGSPSMSNMQTPTAPGVVPAPSTGSLSHTGRGAGVDIKIKGLNIPGITHPHFSYYIADRSRRILRRLAKRNVGGVKRMGAHPHLPYYLTGAQDGSVRLWEWGHNQCIAVARQPGTFPKVTKVLFNAQGNKFGVSDVEGSLCLWQVGLGVNMNKPYLNLKCHTKTTTDFVFVGSSSLLATGGHSSNGRSVCLWDTLLPKSSSMVQGFNCHNDGCSAILFSPKHQVLISSGKTGDICLFDMRHRHLRHTFQAHDSSIRCMALDPAEEFFVTGSADGDIKVWSLGVHNLAYSFPGEHAKNSIFRNMGSGVTQLHMSINSHLFSCGADGSMKVRQLPDRHSIVNTWM